MDIKRVSENAVIVELSRSELETISRLAQAALAETPADAVTAEIAANSQAAIERSRQSTVPELVERMLAEAAQADADWQAQEMFSQRGTNPRPFSPRHYDWPAGSR